jgi:hypothetical protein
MDFRTEFPFPSESPSVYYTAPVSPLSSAPLSPLDTHDEVALLLAESPLVSVPPSPLNTHNEVALLLAGDSEIGSPPNTASTPAGTFSAEITGTKKASKAQGRVTVRK